MVTIWHNPRCSKSRAALAALQEAGIEPDIREYLTDAPTITELTKVCELLGCEPWKYTRLDEDEAKAAKMSEWDREPIDRSRWLEMLAKHPRLIQRPILMSADRIASLGRTPEALEAFIADVREHGEA